MAFLTIVMVRPVTEDYIKGDVNLIVKVIVIADMAL